MLPNILANTILQAAVMKHGKRAVQVQENATRERESSNGGTQEAGKKEPMAYRCFPKVSLRSLHFFFFALSYANTQCNAHPSSTRPGFWVLGGLRARLRNEATARRGKSNLLEGSCMEQASERASFLAEIQEGLLWPRPLVNVCPGLHPRGPPDRQRVLQRLFWGEIHYAVCTLPSILRK